jgi:hypothetical protein
LCVELAFSNLHRNFHLRKFFHYSDKMIVHILKVPDFLHGWSTDKICYIYLMFKKVDHAGEMGRGELKDGELFAMSFSNSLLSASVKMRIHAPVTSVITSTTCIGRDAL